MTITEEEATHVLATYGEARTMRNCFTINYTVEQIRRIKGVINIFGMGGNIIFTATNNLSNLPGYYSNLCKLYDENPWLASQDHLPPRKTLDDDFLRMRQEVRQQYDDSSRFRNRISRALLDNSRLRKLLLDD
jgi:hypothetical protein